MTPLPGAVTRRLLACRTLTLVLGFVLLDLLGGYLYTLHLDGILPSRFFRLARDRGFGELIQYLKYGVVILLLVDWRRRAPSKLLTAWILLFTIILLDDSLGLHEAMGKLIASLAGLETLWGREAKDVFELLAFALLEGVAFLFVFIRFLPAPPDLQRFSLLLGLAMSPLFLSGFLLDALPWHVAEEAGEMLGGILPAAYVHWHARHRAPPTIHAPPPIARGAPAKG